jgi:hypothetical protein
MKLRKVAFSICKQLGLIIVSLVGKTVVFVGGKITVSFLKNRKNAGKPTNIMKVIKGHLEVGIPRLNCNGKWISIVLFFIHF